MQDIRRRGAPGGPPTGPAMGPRKDWEALLTAPRAPSEALRGRLSPDASRLRARPRAGASGPRAGRGRRAGVCAGDRGRGQGRGPGPGARWSGAAVRSWARPAPKAGKPVLGQQILGRTGRSGATLDGRPGSPWAGGGSGWASSGGRAERAVRDRRRAHLLPHERTTPLGAHRAHSGVVGVRGFEPPTSASRTQRSTKLSHTPVRAEDSMEGAPVRQAREPALAAGRRGGRREDAPIRRRVDARGRPAGSWPRPNRTSRGSGRAGGGSARSRGHVPGGSRRAMVRPWSSRGDRRTPVSVPRCVPGGHARSAGIHPRLSWVHALNPGSTRSSPRPPDARTRCRAPRSGGRDPRSICPDPRSTSPDPRSISPDPRRPHRSGGRARP